MTDTTFSQSRVLVLEPGRAERHYWRDIWAYRELFAILAWRDIAVRYKQTVIGVAWALVRPLLTMVVFTVIFGRLAKLPSEGGAPYPSWCSPAAALVLLDALSEAVGQPGRQRQPHRQGLFSAPHRSDRVRGRGIRRFRHQLRDLLGLMIWYGFLPGWRIVLLPALRAAGLLASLGPAFLLTALNVKYRDFRYIIPFIVQFGLYISPVGFSSAVVPEQWRFWYSLNPMVGVIDGFRWCVLGGDSRLYMPGFLLSLGVVALFLWLGIAYFRRTERSFADLI